MTRSDLPGGAQATQAAHAACAFCLSHPTSARHWFDTSQYLILLQVADEKALSALRRAATARGIPTTAYHEEDLGGALMAVALDPCPEARRLTANLPLLLRPKAAAAA